MGGGGGGGGEGGAHERLRHVLNPERRRRECGGILPQEILKKYVILDSINFVRFEDSLLGNKTGKSEGH